VVPSGADRPAHGGQRTDHPRLTGGSLMSIERALVIVILVLLIVYIVTQVL
jgi:hypothetical protein